MDTRDAQILTSPTDTLKAEPNDHYRSIAIAGIIVVLLGLCSLLALPFLPALAWGAAFAIIAWPLHTRMKRWISSANCAAFATTAIVMIVIVVPGLLIAYQLTQEASSGAERMKAVAVEGTLRDWLSQSPKMQRVVEWMDRINVDLEAELRKVLSPFVSGATSLLQGSLLAIIQFALAIFILFHFLKDGAVLREQVRGLLPMSRSDCNRVFKTAADSVHANIYASAMTSLINAITGGLLFSALGLPSPVLWGIVIFFMSILPVLGTFIVWMPATIYFILVSQWGNAGMLAAWGVGSAIIVDTILYGRLVGNRMQIHQVPALLSFLGGLALFGPTGMILGPAILAVTVAMLEVWKHRPAPDEQQTPVSVTVQGDAEVQIVENGQSKQASSGRNVVIATS